MNAISFDVEGDWLGGVSDDDDATFGALVVEVGGVPLTEVDDSISRTTRRAIRVPAIRVARWLLTEWWRLRWEPQPASLTRQWRAVHSMAGIGGGFAWPDLRVASDGEFVQLTIVGERNADVAAIRYLRNVTIETSVDEWERAVERFLDKVQSRLADVLPHERELTELREELHQERSDAALARHCRRQANAGYEPGEAPTEWTKAVEGLEKQIGAVSTDDLLVANQNVAEVEAIVRAFRSSSCSVDLSAATGLIGVSNSKPWERGVQGAQAMRRKLGLAEGALKDDLLAEVLGNRLPLRGDAPATSIPGAFRAADGGGVARVRLGAQRPTSQRFAVARLLGMAAQLESSQQVVVLTEAKTAKQKAARSFAQELLLPWNELDALTDHGTSDDTIASIAERYEVSEMVVATTLVNRGKLDRDRLDRYPT